MANEVIFLHKSLDTVSYPSIALSITVASEDTAYPLTNLQDGHKTSRCITDGTDNNQTIVFDLGATTAVDSFGCVNHNFESLMTDTDTSSISFQGAADSGFSSGLVTAWTLAGNAGLAALGADPFYQSFNSQSKRYWRLLFNNTSSALLDKPAIGEIFIGAKFQHSYRYALPDEAASKYSNVIQESWDGSSSVAQRYSTIRREWRLPLQVLGSTYKTNLDTFFQSVRGSYRTFMMTLDGGTTWYFVRLNQNEIRYTERSANYWETTLEIIEELG